METLWVVKNVVVVITLRVNRKLVYKQIKSKTEHTLIAGVSGFGKGMFGEGYIHRMAKTGKKVLDINSESRGEGMYYSIPQTDSNLMKRITYLSNGKLKPQSHKNEIIMFLGNNLKKIPELPNNVKVCVFNERWLSNEDLKKFLAFNPAQSEFLEAIFEIHNDQQIPLSYLYDFLSKAADEKSKEKAALKSAGTHYGTVNTIKRRCRNLLRSGLFYRDKDDMENSFHFLDLEASMRDIESITTFSTYLIDDPYIRFICISILIKKFIEFIESRQFSTPIVFYVREANDFYYMKSNVPEYLVDIQNNFEKILRKGRALGGSKVTVIMDTQLFNDLPPQVFSSFNKYICFRLPTSDSKLLLRKADIPELYLKKLATCDVGMGMYVVNGTFEYPYLFYPTLHKKADADFDVFAYLSKKFGSKSYKKSKFLELDLLPSKNESEFIVPQEVQV